MTEQNYQDTARQILNDILGIGADEYRMYRLSAFLDRSHADIINKERQRMADAMTEHLQKLGAQVRIAHYTGDSSYPTEYTITFQDVQEVGPTFELTLTAWIERLIENKAKVSDTPECTLLGTSTSMPNSEFERKTYLMTLKDSGKEVPFNLQVHADGTIVAEPRPVHETDYDDLDYEDEEEEEEDDPGDWNEEEEEDEEYGALDEDDPRR